MEIVWSAEAADDLERVHAFLLPKNLRAASDVFARLYCAPDQLAVHSRLGVVLDAYHPREVRRLVVDDYEIRYEVTAATVVVLRVWHSREDR